jgi:hypothetical protein
MRGSNRDDEALMVFYALLLAERWLFVAGATADECRRGVKCRTLNGLRRSVARSLEGLQPKAYRALKRSTSSRQI